MTKAVQFIKITLKCNMEIAVFAENLVSEVNILRGVRLGYISLFSAVSVLTDKTLAKDKGKTCIKIVFI